MRLPEPGNANPVNQGVDHQRLRLAPDFDHHVPDLQRDEHIPSARAAATPAPPEDGLVASRTRLPGLEPREDVLLAHRHREQEPPNNQDDQERRGTGDFQAVAPLGPGPRLPCRYRGERGREGEHHGSAQQGVGGKVRPLDHPSDPLHRSEEKPGKEAGPTLPSPQQKEEAHEQETHRAVAAEEREPFVREPRLERMAELKEAPELEDLVGAGPPPNPFARTLMTRPGPRASSSTRNRQG